MSNLVLAELKLKLFSQLLEGIQHLCCWLPKQVAKIVHYGGEIFLYTTEATKRVASSFYAQVNECGKVNYAVSSVIHFDFCSRFAWDVAAAAGRSCERWADRRRRERGLEESGTEPTCARLPRFGSELPEARR